MLSGSTTKGPVQIKTSKASRFGRASQTREIPFHEKALGWKIVQWGDQDHWLVGLPAQDGQSGIDGKLSPTRRVNWPSVDNTVDVASLDDTLAAVEANGGKVLMPRMARCQGRWLHDLLPGSGG